ncbi:MBOAT family O-acyltransferase [Aquimarina algiphila]|uniref:MBOAT family protein n=1 Tax=Aquimarina algiphila TaxID=2047982 RepID=A0A554VDB0_9FLAO|nr:MBOAT family O-acyltransferase [Aquimarina algiphila]TSE04843.1 MBOAT family protein [Aquimarina algiphila]
MLFNSVDFFIFLSLVFIGYWFVVYKNLRLQNILLLVASYVFYGWWDWRFLSLIALSTIIDYTAGFRIYESEEKSIKKRWLWVSIIFNLGMLGFFKYYNFFIDSWIDLFAAMGYELQSTWTLQIILPVGISFYTFQTLSYSIDIYKEKLQPTKDFIAFAAFVSFFPQLVAGPIERATNLVPQFLKKRTFTYKTFSYGIKLMIWGFFLKLVVADRAAIYVNAVYNNTENHDGLSFIAATVLFAFQIYGDFAGYSLIAIGTSKLFGFDLMTNFRRPYFSASVSEFWTRWHISLSTWFRDYLYIPLGGNRVAKPRWLFNLFITFLISGLWHGANWTFVVWGALNGLYLIVEVLLFKKRRKGVFNVVLTFALINFAWVFFRANSIEDAFYIIKRICTVPGRLYIGSGDDITASLYATLAIAILVLVELKKEYFNTLFSISNHKYEFVRLTGYAVLIYMIMYFGVFGKSQFIYFQF